MISSIIWSFQLNVFGCWCISSDSTDVISESLTSNSNILSPPSDGTDDSRSHQPDLSSISKLEDPVSTNLESDNQKDVSNEFESKSVEESIVRSPKLPPKARTVTSSDSSFTSLDLLVKDNARRLDSFKRQDRIISSMKANKQDARGNTPLHAAAKNKSKTSLQIINKLVGQSAFDPNQTNHLGKTALHIAAANGNDAVVKIFVDKGSDPNAADKRGWTPLHHASVNGHTIVVQPLIENGAHPDQADHQGHASIHIAAQQGQDEMISVLVANGADPNAKDYRGLKKVGTARSTNVFDHDAKNEVGWTALHHAAFCDEVIKTLLDNGTSLSDEDHNGHTAFRVAADQGNCHFLRRMNENGANSNGKDKDGLTALHSASKGGNDSVVQTLIELGTNPNATDSLGKTCLHYAVRSKHKSVIKFLIDSGVDIEARDYNGKTAMTVAVENRLRKTASLSGFLDAPKKGQRRRQSVADADFDDSLEILALLDTKESQVKSKLENATILSHQARKRMTLYTVVVGSLGLVGSNVMAQLLLNHEISTDDFGFAGYYSSLAFPSASLMLLGLLPNDTFLIRILSLAMVIGVFLYGIYSIFASAMLWFVDSNKNTDYDGEETLYACGADLPSVGCAIFAARDLFRGLIYIIFAYGLRRNLVRIPGAKIFDNTEGQVFRYTDKSFEVPSRKALNNIWQCVRMWAGIIGILSALYGIVCYVLDDQAPWYSQGLLASDLVDGLSKVFLSACLSDDRRHKLAGSLSAMTTRHEARSAASITALLGGRNAADSLEKAKSKFRSISFDKLSEQDFATNKEEADRVNTLFDATEPTNLGKCDVFMSHSWSDNGEKKYAILAEWCENFKAEHGRYPKIWFDKACIDQSHIDDDLLCLPIFLAGCNTLILIVGPTYTSRLWCIMEVFTFLQMGGDIERITVLPIDMENERAAKDIFQRVDIAECKCYRSSDRQKLLGIVEQSFRGFQEFNDTVHHVFERRMVLSPQHSFKASVKDRSKKKNSVVPIPDILSTMEACSSVEVHQDSNPHVLIDQEKVNDALATSSKQPEDPMSQVSAH